MVWHLQGLAYPSHFMGFSIPVTAPFFCGLVSDARSDFEGFLFMQGAGEPFLPSCCHVGSCRLWMEVGESTGGAVTQV